MPRYARIQYPGGIHHLISRCVNKQFLIKGPAERKKYLQLLGEAAKKTDAIILAYCIMSNHIHLVVRSGRDPLERLMKSTHSGFAGWLNRHLQGRTGPVFADRYKSILVEEEDAFLLELIRYVHNNPVRAKKVKSAEDSNWSSHRAYIGMEEAPEWLNTGYVLSMMSKKVGWARRQLQRFVQEGRDESRRSDLSGKESTAAARRFKSAFGDGLRINGPIIGSEAFAAKVIKDICAVDRKVTAGGHVRAGKKGEYPTLDELIALVCSQVGLEPWQFEHQPKRRGPALARRLIVYLWVSEYGGRQCDVARKLKASSAAVTKWYSRAVLQLPELKTVLDKIKSKFSRFSPSVGRRARLTPEPE